MAENPKKKKPDVADRVRGAINSALEPIRRAGQGVQAKASSAADRAKAPAQRVQAKASSAANRAAAPVRKLQAKAANAARRTNAPETPRATTPRATPAQAKPKKSTYAEAKKKDPKLDSYIKARNAAKKGTSEYNAAQNKINKAYGTGPTTRATKPVTTKAAPVARKAAGQVKSTTTSKPTLKKMVAPKVAKAAPAAAVKRRPKTVAQGADRKDVRADRKAERINKRSKREKSKVVTPKKRVGVTGNRAKTTLNRKLKGLS